jgi:hypothetical protein
MRASPPTPLVAAAVSAVTVARLVAGVAEAPQPVSVSTRGEILWQYETGG